ncbi:MAG: DUF47 domain-containing protein, partial [Desulfovibrionaceae bacterium]
MYLKLPFFGMLSKRSPMEGLVEHYDKIAECIAIIDESLQCYISGGACREFSELSKAIDQVEGHADKIKRNIRNHLPRGFFMAVDKHLFLSYTNSQDNILDEAQEALNWLGVMSVSIPSSLQKPFIDLLGEVRESADLLGPALRATIDLVNGKSLDREGAKNHYRAVRKQRAQAHKLKTGLVRDIFELDMDFKAIFLLMQFVERLDNMSHNCEKCADILR